MENLPAQWCLLNSKPEPTGLDPISTFRDVAHFRHKSALDCALREDMQISQFARIAQNYALRLSEIVRKA